jgi:hypothetical protein
MQALDKEMAPQVLETPRSPAHRKVGTLAVDTRKSSASHVHPSTHDHGDTIAAPTLAWSVRVPASKAGYSSATQTSTARTEKHPTGAAVALIA